MGEYKASLYKKLNILTVDDLLHHIPRDYIDLTNFNEISDYYVGQPIAILANVISKNAILLRGGLQLFKVLVRNEVSDLIITFFNTKYLVDNLKRDEQYIFYGMLSKQDNVYTMTSPSVMDISEQGHFAPIYPATAGITSKIIANDVKRAIQLYSDKLIEILPDYIMQQNNLCSIAEAIKGIHSPTTIEQLDQAKRRLVFEELFILSCALKLSRKDKHLVSVLPMKDVNMQEFWSQISFNPTLSQKDSIDDIIKDFKGNVAMNRLVQGDVGSGKTIVAAAAAYFAIKNGGQTALMAPTEILALQHYNNLKDIFNNLGIETTVITGSLSAKEKKLRRQKVETGQAQLVIGTHALLTDTTEFLNLSFVVTDEQHRFGVSQRAALIAKGSQIHTLVMSATPIPRTLSLIVFGDLDISLMQELPKGRIPVSTYKINSSKRERAYNFIKRYLDKGLQAYIVCSLVEENEENTSLAAANKVYKKLAEEDFIGYNIGLIHGKMKAKEKEKIMLDFKAGTIQLLVSTTVIEVGVDVPNAVIIMIENAERFGLSQLHQLRGRVGRGKEASHCILLCDTKSQTTIDRLDVLCKTTDGFKIAEEDLRIRGPGDFFGNRQHGVSQLSVANLAKDLDIFTQAQQSVESIIEKDPDMSDSKHAPLKNKIKGMIDILSITSN